MFKLLMATCLGVMTPQGPQLVNCQLMVEQTESWYQDKQECMARAQALHKHYEEHFKDTPVITRTSCLTKEQIDKIEVKYGDVSLIEIQL